MIGARVRAGAVLLMVFGVGALAGVALDRHHLRASQAAVSPASEHDAAIAELRQVADLDDRQVEQIHAILAQHQEIVDHMWAQLRPEVQDAMRHVHEEIAALLRPDQRQRFQEWIVRHLDEDGGSQH